METIKMRTTGFKESESIPFKTPQPRQTSENQPQSIFKTEQLPHPMRRGAQPVFHPSEVKVMPSQARGMIFSATHEAQPMRQIGRFRGEGIKPMGVPARVSPFVPPVRHPQVPRPKQVTLSLPTGFSNNPRVAIIRKQLWGY